jgi:hypothetical protein
MDIQQLVSFVQEFYLYFPFYPWKKSSIWYEAGRNPSVALMLWKRAKILPLPEIKP